MTPCPVCGGPTRDAFTKDGIAYRDCAVCGFRFSVHARNANLEQALGEFEPAYLQYLAADPASEGTLGAVLKAAGRSSGTWLDVGCGGGTMVRALRARGIAAEGVEPNEALFAHFLAADERFHHGLDGVAGRRFDVVSALDVLEHVPDPVPFLRSLAGVVAPQGVVLISTPDAGSPAARLLGRRWHHYNRYHSSFFSPATLERAAADARLRVVSTRHPGRRRPLGYAVRYLFEFGLRRDAPAAIDRLDRVAVPINLFDTMLAVLRPHAN